MLPKMVLIKQKPKGTALRSINESLLLELQKVKIYKLIKPGMKIGITVGSRGIKHLNQVLTILINEIRKAGGKPELIAAMGSHGNGTREGRLSLLSSFGISSETMQVPIQADFEELFLGQAVDNGVEVYINKHVFNYDFIILLNRIKPHTSFSGKVESGLLKMAAVGLGGPIGAKIVHSLGVKKLEEMIMVTGKHILTHLPNAIGLGLIENSEEEIHHIQAIPMKMLISEEKKLLEIANKLAPSLPVQELDLLIVNEIGKNFSGTGMDCKVIGRYRTPGIDDPELPEIKRIVVLDMSENSHGNANGIGLADFTTKKLVNKIDYSATYLNATTSTFLSRAMLPLIMATTEEAISWAVKSINKPSDNSIKVALIANTLHLSKLWVSENLLIELDLGKIEILSEPKEFSNINDLKEKASNFCEIE